MANYYYRLRELRKVCLQNIPEESVAQNIVPVPSNLITSSADSAVEITIGKIQIAVSDATSPELLKMVLQVAADVNDAVCFKNVSIAIGYTDLRFGIDSLAALIKSKSGKEPLIPDTLYLFCGRRTDRIKGLDWKSDGHLLLYKRLEQGNFQWPRSESEVRNLSQCCDIV